MKNLFCTFTLTLFTFLFTGCKEGHLEDSVTRHELTLHDMEVQNATYTNEYDPYFRLVSKTDEEGNGFTFIY